MTRSAPFRLRPAAFGRRRVDAPLEVAADTGALVAAVPDAVWPYWLTEQTRPDSPAFVPLGSPPIARNLTHRGWTPVGTLESGLLADVDVRGLVVPKERAGGALDWWVRGPAGWVFPSRCPDDVVRQTLVGDVPVVRTELALEGGGSVVQTVYALAAPDVTVVEFANDTEAPVALALVVRPVDVLGARMVRSVAVTGSGLEVDGVVFAACADAPLAGACGRLGDGDLVGALADVDVSHPGAAGPGRSCEDAAGHATAAGVVILTHGRRLTVVIPSGPAARRALGEDAGSIADADAAVRGWTALRGEPPKVAVADEAVAAAFAAQPGHLLALGRERALEPEIARALCALDLHGQVRAAFSRRIGAGRGPGTAMDVVDFALVAGLLWRHTRDVTYFAGMSGELERVAVGLEREVALAGRRGADAWQVGPRLVKVAAAAAVVAEIADESGIDDLAGAAPAIRAAAEEEADLRFAATRDGLAHDPPRALEWALARTWDPLPHSADPRLAAAVDALGTGTVRHKSGGTDAFASAGLALVLATARSAAAWELVASMAAMAQPAWTWPTLWNPRSGGGCGGSGADAGLAARFVAAVASCCVAPTADGLALAPVLPAGRRLAGSRLATGYGYLDVQVRGEGDAIVLAWRGLWGSRQPVLTAPALDPDWSTPEPAGTVTF